MKITIFSFLHPDICPGGQQNIAYDHFKHHNEEFGDGSALLISSTFGTVINASPGSTLLQINRYEFVYQNPNFDFNFFTNNDQDGMEEIYNLLESFEPQIIHVHHFMGFGIDLFFGLKKLINCRMVFTIHEHLVICHNNGHLLHNGNKSICNEVRPAKCTNCLKDYRFDYFQQRNSIFEQFLNIFDRVVAVSDFTNKIVSETLNIKNVLTLPNGPFMDDFKHQEGIVTLNKNSIKIAYIGQIHPTKGLHILLNSLNKLMSENKKSIKRISLRIWGNFTDSEYEKLIKDGILSLNKRVDALLCGEYASSSLENILSDTDIVVITSTWPESYCLTADEALRLGKILICSDFPALLERYEESGRLYTYKIGNEDSLCQTLLEVILKEEHINSISFKKHFKNKKEYYELLNNEVYGV